MYKASLFLPKYIKQRISFKKCIMPISVGQPYHESDKLQAMISLVSGLSDECHIIVCDTLQRHNQIMDKMAHINSYISGSEWVERSQPYLLNFKIPYKISRWDEFLSDKNYLRSLELIDRIYSTYM
jgi:hypothetical protein